MRLRMFRLFLLLLLAGVLFAGGMKDTLRVAAEPSDTRDDGEEDEYDKAARELERRRQDALDEIKSLKSDISSVEAKIRELQAARSDLQTYISQLDQQVNSIAAQIRQLEGEIEKKKEEIAQKEEELAAAEAESR